jgi:hypothetical protein
MMDAAAVVLGGGLLIYLWLEVMDIWVHRRQPVRDDAPTEGVWSTPEPRYRRHERG